MKRSLSIVCILICAAAATAFGQAATESGKVFWRGMVDDKVHIVIKGLTVETKTVSGREMDAGAFSFTAPLPSTNVTLTAIRKDGRGTVTVVQQPDASNGFTAIVEVNDSRGGADDHLLEISW
ncbi:MAG: hypothetical protein IPM21_10045 [Acidobacteria bacterium]|nr:hypothetical protein [Acidobacteriota bacterium]